MAAQLISLIGPPAAGKTTSARWLVQELGGRLICEDFAGNPFLEQSYLGHKDLALPAQLYFLFSRLGQLNRAAWPESGLAVSDYAFRQDAVYARANLSGADLDVYHRLAAQVEDMVKKPDLLIALDGSESLLLERIARRGRRHETAFTADFLSGMRREYRQVVEQAQCPVIDVDIDTEDLLAAPVRRQLLDRIAKVLR